MIVQKTKTKCAQHVSEAQNKFIQVWIATSALVIVGFVLNGCAQESAVRNIAATTPVQNEAIVQNASLKKSDYPDVFGKVQSEAPETQVLSADDVHRIVQNLEAENASLLATNKRKIDDRVY